MFQLLYKSDGVQATGVMPGAYRFAADATLAHARLVMVPPTAGVVTLALEVDGALAEVDGAPVVFSITASAQEEVNVKKLLNLSVAEGAVVRWRVTDFTAPVEDGPLPVSITMAYRSAAFADSLILADALTVRWVNGLERLTLFDYDPATRAFSESLESEGISAARAVIATGAWVNISIEGATVLRVISGSLWCAALEGLGGVATREEPRLEFYVNQTRIATLSAESILRVACAEQTSGVADDEADEVFAFHSSGVAISVLGERWLRSRAFDIGAT